ncbi:MAG: helix-turn-helix transcriptional regulator [Thermanaeromonas sp.]|uniref:response regulator transcription factor n=1 Tax=Thermanaeromonas sp. TaxID=2003697 RepID=UPI002440AF8D|nr:helix-turn-helix transcriptional regulator [Thermanaeromonas sp.]MCG0278920.1 helix-turn-helix transcriptional regulator [Thermanaeromonas sp.]
MGGRERDVRVVLSPLELKVALLARAGLKRWEIARVLNIKEGTVKSQLERITAKLQPGWKKSSFWLWPEVSGELEEAVNELRDLHCQKDNEILSEYTLVRKAVEGDLPGSEAAVLYLLGYPSFKGRKFIGVARSLQWKLIQLGDKGEVLALSAGARFWLKPALEVLTENRHLKFLHSDKTSYYRPSWLPYLVSGRARGTRGAYYRITGNREYVQGFLLKWSHTELERYVKNLHSIMAKRWQALSRMACLAGRQPPHPLPTTEMLWREARSFLFPEEETCRGL